MTREVTVSIIIVVVMITSRQVFNAHGISTSPSHFPDPPQWQIVSEREAYHFCSETMKNTRESPHSCSSPAMLMAEVCVDTVEP